MRAFRSHATNSLYGIAAEKIAEWCGCHLTTARRWKRPTEQPPKSALILISLKTGGDLGVIEPKWSGWKFSNGFLVAPDQTEFRAADVMAGPFWRRLAKHYQAAQKFPAQADWIDQQWVPAREIDAGYG